MSQTTSLRPRQRRRPATKLEWTAISSKLWVAKQGTDFAGMVCSDQLGEYAAFDRFSREIDVFYDLASAKLAVELLPGDQPH